MDEKRKKSSKKALALIRRLLALASLALVCAAFVFPRELDGALAFWSKFQFGQALARLASGDGFLVVAQVAAMALLTFFFGRWFCGFACPLGALMDLAGRVKDLFKKRRFAYKPISLKKTFIPAVALIAFWLGATTLFGLLEPYSVLVSKSLLYNGPNLLLLAVVLIAAFFGRAFCEWLCPTGLALKIFSAGSPFHLYIGEDCLRCGACSKVCSASCLNGHAKTLDRGRCLMCLDCLSKCPNGSLKWGRVPAISPELKRSRRSFFGRGVLTALAAVSWRVPQSARAKTFGEPKEAPILPPGAMSLAHLGAHCSLCHGCVRICPNQALTPSRSPHPALWNRPVLDPYLGFCQYDCVLCGQICPTGALTPLTVEAKRQTRLGLVVFDRYECVVIKNDTSCGACAELCPTGAVRMAPSSSGREEPTIRENLCVGCGACQQACPVRPISAIRVNGLLTHQVADRPVVIKTEDEALPEEFPF
jgi:ferredoxin